MKETLVFVAKAVLFLLGVLLGGWPVGPSEPDAISKMQLPPRRKPLVTCAKCSTEITFDTTVCPKCRFNFGSGAA
jgi:hypothetical protein